MRDRRGPNRGWWAVGGAVVAVAALAVVLALALHGNGGDTPPDADAAPDGFVGYRWTVTTMHDARGSLGVPDDLVATIGFAPGGKVFGNDTVNGLIGRYSMTRTGYVVRDVGSTLVAYAGGDPQRARVIGAVDAMFFRLHSSAPLVVTSSSDGHTLTLAQGGTTLELRESGTEHDAPPPSATSTG